MTLLRGIALAKWRSWTEECVLMCRSRLWKPLVNYFAIRYFIETHLNCKGRDVKFHNLFLKLPCATPRRLARIGESLRDRAEGLWRLYCVVRNPQSNLPFLALARIDLVLKYLVGTVQSVHWSTRRLSSNLDYQQKHVPYLLPDKPDCPFTSQRTPILIEPPQFWIVRTYHVVCVHSSLIQRWDAVHALA